MPGGAEDNMPQEFPSTTQSPAPGLPTSAARVQEGTFSVADLRKLFAKRKWWILACVVIGLAIAIYHNATAIPQYDTFVSVDIDLDRTPNVGFSSLVGNAYDFFGTDAKLQTQLKILSSDSVAWSVIERLKLYNDQPFSQVFGKQGYQGSFTPAEKQALIGMFRGSMHVVLVPETNLAQIHFTNQNPYVAQKVAGAVVDAYEDWNLQTHVNTMAHISTWLSSQMETLRDRASQAQQALVQYQQKNNLISVGQNGQTLLDANLATLNSQLAQARADTIVREARYKMAQTRNPDLLVSVAPNPVLTSLREQEATLMAEQAQLQSKFGPNYPQLQEVSQQLNQLHRDIAQEISSLTQRFKTEYDASLQTENLLQARLNSVEQSAYQQNQSATQFEILKEKAMTASSLYNALQLRLQEAGITAGLNSDTIEVIDPAPLPLVPVSPQRHRSLLYGLLGGLIVGLGLALLLDALDDTLRTTEETESFSRLPALSIIPHFASNGVGVASSFWSKFRKNQGANADVGKVPGVSSPSSGNIAPDLVALNESHSLAAESFRTLRASVLLSSVDREPKVILVTSGMAAEGKSTCAANLAISFAQQTARVLLVDADLRMGTQHMKFQTSNRKGLSTYLSRESGEDSILHPVASLPNLSLIPRGPYPPNPGEMLSSHMLADTIARWREAYDYIVIDSSPVLAVADALSLGQLVDGTLLVIRSGVTKKKALTRTRELLRRAKVSLLGAVINDQNLHAESYYGYGHQGKGESAYGFGYGNGGSEDAR